MLARIDGLLFVQRHPFGFNSVASKQASNLLVPVVETKTDPNPQNGGEKGRKGIEYERAAVKS